jgi:hypothetical protein
LIKKSCPKKIKAGIAIFLQAIGNTVEGNLVCPLSLSGEIKEVGFELPEDSTVAVSLLPTIKRVLYFI